MTENGVPSTEMLSIWRDVDDLDGRGGRVFFICNRSCFRLGSCKNLDLSTVARVDNNIGRIDPLSVFLV